MKKFATIFLTLFALVAFVSAANANVTIRYYNKDSKDHTMEVKIAGMTREVEFDASCTATVTIHGGDSTAEIETDCGTIEVEDGDRIEIEDGCIEIQ